MKRIFSVLLLSPLMVVAQNKLNISAKIAGLKEGAKVILVDMNKVTDTLGKATVKQGAFTLKASLKEATLASMDFDNGKKLPLFLENSNVKINGDIADVKAIAVKGSATHAAFDEFQKTFNPLFESFGKTSQQMQFRGATDSLKTVINTLQNNIQKEVDVFIKKYNSSPVSSFLLVVTFQLTEDIFITEKRYASLAKSAGENLYGSYLKQMIAEGKVLAIGTEALEFTQSDTLGTPVSLSSFRGKYVLLDFWASWCGPCRQENPNVVSNFNKFKEKNFTVLGVSLDKPGQKDRWLQAIHADNLTWTHVSDLNFWNNAVAQQYKVQSIPQNFLIGPDGKIVAKNLRGQDLESKLCELLGCN